MQFLRLYYFCPKFYFLVIPAWSVYVIGQFSLLVSSSMIVREWPLQFSFHYSSPNPQFFPPTPTLLPFPPTSPHHPLAQMRLFTLSVIPHICRGHRIQCLWRNFRLNTPLCIGGNVHLGRECVQFCQQILCGENLDEYSVCGEKLQI